MHCVLIIDDDTELCESLKESLNSEGFFATAVRDGVEGLRKALSGNYDVALVDDLTPPTDGFRVLREIRSHSDLPVLMTSGYGRETEHIEALDMGADDYLLKPFDPRTLAARIRAILRRIRQNPELSHDARTPGEDCALGDIALDTGARIAYRGGNPLELTSVEFNLLEILIRSAGQVVSREELAKGAMGRALGMNDRSIDVHISSLRKKLGHRFRGTDRIRTVRNWGYLYTRPNPLLKDFAGTE